MRRLSKENLFDRVVGYDVDHPIDPSQYEEGKPTSLKRTVWARVCHPFPAVPGSFVGINIHTEDVVMIHADAIHTTMPRERYEYL